MSKAETLRSMFERIEACKRTFMLDELVDLQRVQAISQCNQKNFMVTLVSAHQVRGDAAMYDKFIDKYLSYLESKQ